jgi:DNA polymerase-2
VADYVRAFVAEVREGEHDAELVYRKTLRKPLASYTAATPPHVQAARRAGPTGRLVEYVMTVAGPEPASGREHAIDHQHYVDRQLRPIAEAVLGELGLDWDEVMGNPRQPGLF